MPARATRVRRACGTLYFPALDKREAWTEYMKDLTSRQVSDVTMKFFSAVKFFQCQPELCPDTKRLHIQWYAELEDPLTINEIQDLVEGGLKLKGHVEPCKGSQKQNIDYVSKQRSSAVAEFPELQHQIGHPCRQGARSDLNDAAADIVSGKRTLAQLIQEQPGLYVKYAKNWNDLSLQFSRPRQLGAKKVLWFYGPTGTGKTREAYDLCMQDGREPFVLGPANGRWWDGYQHTAGLDSTIPVIMDEFRGDLKMGYMLQLLDRYRMKVEFK